MYLRSNLYLLRKRSGITQEALAQQMGVSRQAVSKWESGEVTPELGKLMELADLFGCKLDALLREDLSVPVSSVAFYQVKRFRMASYVVVSPNPEEDARAYLDKWARKSGLLDCPGYLPRCIGWGFPYVSQEQKQRFGLRGYVCAYLLPEDFQPAVDGPDICRQEDCCYAAVTIEEVCGRDPKQISRAIQAILQALSEQGAKKSAEADFLPCFERRYEQDGIHFADVFVQCRISDDRIILPEKEI